MTSPTDSAPEKKSSTVAATEAQAAKTPAGLQEHFVVAVGASAGGLEAISELLRAIRGDSGITLLIAQHLAAEHSSLLVELLSRVSSLPVAWAEHGRAIETGRVYVAPAKSMLGLKQGVMMLEEETRRPSAVIDHLFESLAVELRERAVGVVLSGTGSDGASGVRAIKEGGGIVFAQTEASAGHPEMPRAAVESGCVDRVLAPEAIADELIRLTHTARALWKSLGSADEAEEAGLETERFQAIFRLLALRTGVDFSEYKPSTIKRRLMRRMVLAKTPDLAEYIKLLQKSRDELGQLYESLLINVTEFFRDPDYFDFIQENVIPEIIRQHADGTPIRVWVPGCASGEEAYSLAILMRERLEDTGNLLPVQIFSTDVSDQAIATARTGLYSVAEVAKVDPKRLRRFFFKTERGYVVQKPIRDMCIFARQNVVKDSPFSRLDLISCRNLMIYLGAKLQRRLMPLFHYALSPGGFLVLGSSESVGGFAELFRLIDRRYRIYGRKFSTRRAPIDFSLENTTPRTPALPKAASEMPEEQKDPFDVFREADRIIVNRHGPTGVLVTEEMEILQFRGDVSRYLAPVEGRASLNLIKMAPEGLSAELQAAVEEARKKNVRVRRGGIAFMNGKQEQRVEIDVTPIDAVQGKDRFYLVLFASSEPRGKGEAATPAAGKRAGGKSVQAAQVDQLRQDLNATRNYLQATIERHEATNQELRAANEEIQSSNEELQSTNEELETAKEELQSTNEELTTVNEELHSRQLELLQLNNDLNNLINSVHLPIIILAQDMRIRRFTPMAEKVLNLIPTDIGRPLTDLNISLSIGDLPALMREVIDSLTIKELEVQDNRGRWHSMRLRPYRTAENKIEGVVLTLIDIDEMKRTMSELVEMRDFAEAVIESTADPMVALDVNLRVKKANSAFYRLFKTTKERAEGNPFFDAFKESEAASVLRAQLEGILPTHSRLTNHEVQIDLPGSGPTRLVINVHEIASGTRTYPLILLTLRRI
jgi:two-component system CheB/CheR fusion protein